MLFYQKKCRIFCLLFLLAACSGGKEIPQGERVSILDVSASSPQTQTSTFQSFNLSKQHALQNWTQTASGPLHLSKNISASADMYEAWSQSFGKSPSKRNLLIAAPIVLNGVIYTQDVQGSVCAFDLKDGHQIFKQKLKPSNENDSASSLNGAGLAADDKKVYALTGFGSVFALHAKTGQIIWRQDLNVPLRVAPTVAKNTLFVQTIDNQLLALDTQDGSEIWSYSMSSEDTVLAGGAAAAYDADKEIVVAAFSNGELQAFDAKIGYSIWSNNLVNTGSFGSTSPINAVKAAPIIDGNVVYAIGNNEQTIAADLESGDILWQRKIGGVNTPLVDDEVVFIVSNNYQLMALSKKTGETIWQKPLLDNLSSKERAELYVSGPLLINSELMVTVSNGLVLTFNPKNGVQKSELDLKERLPFAPVVAERRILFTTNDAEIIVYQ